MSGEGRPMEIVLRITANELEMIKQAARLDGVPDVAVTKWMSETLVQEALARLEKKGGRGPSGGETKFNVKIEYPPVARMCDCGATQDARGECDGSCLMQL